MYEHIISVSRFIWKLSWHNKHNLIHSFVTSYVGYFTSLLYVMSDRQHIKLKILMTTYKRINTTAPEYLCQLVSIRKSSRNLSSFSQIILMSSRHSWASQSVGLVADELWVRGSGSCNVFMWRLVHSSIKWVPDRMWWLVLSNALGL